MKNNLTGLEFIQGIISGEIQHPPISQTIPMKMIKAEDGRVEFEVQADDRHINPMGGVHGGFAATVLDSVTGCAVHTTLPANVIYATVDLNVKMVKPVPLDTKLIAIGNVISKSKLVSTAEGCLKDADGKYMLTALQRASLNPGRIEMLAAYQGSCHCGAIKFEVLTDLDHAVICDCSLCRRRGTTMVRCDETDMNILSGAENLTCYQFNTHVAKHYFCKSCGIYVFHKMRKLPDKYGINAGCLHGVDPYALKPILVEGSKR